MLASVVTIALMASSPSVYEVATHLDLRSFPNSTGPRRVANFKTPWDYGFSKVERLNGSIVMLQADRSWELILTPVAMGRGQVFCFTDHALNGGTYNSQTPIRVARQADGTFHVTPVRKPVGDCADR